MKKLFLILLSFSPLLSLGQYIGYDKAQFFNRQPSARAEAMGRSYSSIDGDITSSFYNPAGIATIEGAEFTSSFSSKYYLLEDAKYTYLGLGYRFHQYFTLGVTMNRLSLGEIIGVDMQGGNESSYTPNTTIYTISAASEPIKDLLVGLNTNLIVDQNSDNESPSSLYFDFGVIKNFYFNRDQNFQHKVGLGASIINFNYAKQTFSFGSDDLPVITRIGGNYQMTIKSNPWLEELNAFRFLASLDYQWVLNSDFHRGIRTGGEILLMELLAIRAGYYHENQNDYGQDVNTDEQSEFTFGLGIQAPLNKLTNVPLLVNFDYASAPQPSGARDYTFSNYSVYSLRVRWLLEN